MHNDCNLEITKHAVNESAATMMTTIVLVTGETATTPTVTSMMINDSAAAAVTMTQVDSNGVGVVAQQTLPASAIFFTSGKASKFSCFKKSINGTTYFIWSR